MSRIGINEIGKYEQTGGGDIPYFNALKDDKDTAIVRFMYQHEEEIDVFAVHSVPVVNHEGKEFNRAVGCLAPSGQPCPLCNGGYYRQIKIYIHMLVNGEYAIWERGKTMVPKITGLFPRYGRGENGLWGREFEIQRNGAKGDTKTSYEIYPLDPDNPKLDYGDDGVVEAINGQPVEKMEIEGPIILKWDAQTMLDYLDGIDVYNKDRNDEGVAPRQQSNNNGRSQGHQRQQSRPQPPASTGREVF